MKNFIALLSIFTFSLSTAFAYPASKNHEAQDFISMMVSKYHFNQQDLEKLFSQVDIYQAKKSHSSAKKYIPLESRPWYIYKQRFITDARVAGGVKFMHEYPKTLARAEKTYGVPASMITAIIGIESNYGGNRGNDSVINVLSTYAFTNGRRASFFSNELKEYLLLCREQKLNPLKLTGSYAGAIGQPQFMPSSYRHYAVDFSGDGQADLVNNEVDVIGSVANYFEKNGWQRGQRIAIPATMKPHQPIRFPDTGFALKYTVGELEKDYQIYPTVKLPLNTKVSFIKLQGRDKMEYWLGLQNFHVITRYNHSVNYAMVAFQLSQLIR